VLGNRKGHCEPKSIVRIAGKYQLEPNHLIDAFVEAWRETNSYYDPLRITCRGVKQDSATFLITNQEKVVAQFPINLEYLKNPQTLKSDSHDIPIPISPPKKSIMQQKRVNELTAGMKGVDVKATIVEVPPSKSVYSKWGEPCSVSNVKLNDDTGTIRLCLWNDHINSVHVGDSSEVKNGYVYNFNGELQLRLRKHSTLSIIT
jgi:hypothetical protein